MKFTLNSALRLPQKACRHSLFPLRKRLLENDLHVERKQAHFFSSFSDIYIPLFSTNTSPVSRMERDNDPKEEAMPHPSNQHPTHFMRPLCETRHLSLKKRRSIGAVVSRNFKCTKDRFFSLSFQFCESTNSGVFYDQHSLQSFPRKLDIFLWPQEEHAMCAMRATPQSPRTEA